MMFHSSTRLSKMYLLSVFGNAVSAVLAGMLTPSKNTHPSTVQTASDNPLEMTGLLRGQTYHTPPLSDV
jgi:hypothetical protein